MRCTAVLVALAAGTPTVLAQRKPRVSPELHVSTLREVREGRVPNSINQKEYGRVWRVWRACMGSVEDRRAPRLPAACRMIHSPVYPRSTVCPAASHPPRF